MLPTAIRRFPAVPAMAVVLLLSCTVMKAQDSGSAPGTNPPAASPGAAPEPSGDAAFLSNAPSTTAPDLPEPAPSATPASPSQDSLTPPPEPAPSASPKAPSSETVSRSEVRDLSVKGPNADSPFFVERQEAKAALTREAREGFGMYVPKPPHPPVGQQVKKFLHGMLGYGRDGKGQGASQIVMTVEPSDFSLASTSEVDVTLRLTNQRRHEIELLYPDNQRLEILVKDPSGAVITRWSQDRAFDPAEGFVEVNPKEFISYTERLSTSGMKPGTTYTVEVSIANQSGYVASQKITPRP